MNSTNDGKWFDSEYKKESSYCLNYKIQVNLSLNLEIKLKIRE